MGGINEGIRENAAADAALFSWRAAFSSFSQLSCCGNQGSDSILLCDDIRWVWVVGSCVVPLRYMSLATFSTVLIYIEGVTVLNVARLM